MNYCTKCGRPLADGEVCNCEAAAKAAVEAAADTAAEKAEEAKTDIITKVKNDPKLLKAVIAGAAAVFAILLFIIIIAAAAKPYMAPVKSLVKEINKGTKADPMAISSAAFPDDFGKVSESAMDLLTKSDMGKLFEAYIEEAKDQFGDLKDEISKWELTYEVASKDKITKDDLKDIREEYEDLWDDELEDIYDELKDTDNDDIEKEADEAGVSVSDYKKFMKSYAKYLKSFEKAKVTKGYKVKLNYVLKDGKKVVDKTDKVVIYIIKINGEWTIHSSKNNERFSFKDDNEDYDYSDYKFIEDYLNSFYGKSAGSNPLLG